MIRRALLPAAFAILILSTVSFAQDDPGRTEIWKSFNKENWHRFDFAKRRLTRVRLNRLQGDEAAHKLELLRGVVFGKRGRVFRERSIQDYLDKQSWYKPNKNFSNSNLTETERTNLDLIRLAEAARHSFVEPGDMRIWEKRLITDDYLRSYSGAELAILIAEIEAIHGKTFPNEEWLQRYFDERYWYKRSPNYSPAVLTDIDRKNIEKLIAEKDKGRKTAIAIGDMDHFQNVALTDDKLKGLTLLELRIIREEFWARHGKKFDAPGIQSYFDWRDWYKPAKNQKTIRLSRTEEQNVATIEAYEARMRERLSTDPLSDETLGELFAEDLRVLRNEIYARHGRIFRDKNLQQYFETQAWYTPDPEFKDEMLSEVESENLKKIRAAEEVAISKFVLVEG